MKKLLFLLISLLPILIKAQPICNLTRLTKISDTTMFQVGYGCYLRRVPFSSLDSAISSNSYLPPATQIPYGNHNGTGDTSNQLFYYNPAGAFAGIVFGKTDGRFGIVAADSQACEFEEGTSHNFSTLIVDSNLIQFYFALSGHSPVLYSFPDTQGLSGQVITNDGGGNLYWSTPSVSSGTVTSVSVVTNQGVSGSVATATTTPAITLSLGTLTGVTSLNGLIVTANTGVITTGTWNGTKIAIPYETPSGSLGEFNYDSSGFFSANGGFKAQFNGTTFYGIALQDNSTKLNQFIGTGVNPIGNSTGTGGYNIGISSFGTFTSYTTATKNVSLGNSSSTLFTNAHDNVAIGQNAAYGDTNLIYSVMIGTNSGDLAYQASSSVFLGASTGSGAHWGGNSEFVGVDAGHNAFTANNSIFIGTDAGWQDETVNNFGSLTYTGLSGTFQYNDLITDNTSGAEGLVVGHTSSSLTYQSASWGLGGDFAVGHTITGSPSGATATIATLTPNSTSILIGDNSSTGGFSNSIAIGNKATNTMANQFLISAAYKNWNMGGLAYFLPRGNGTTGQFLADSLISSVNHLVWTTPAPTGNVTSLTGTSGTPTFTAGAAAGTSPTISVQGTNIGGLVNVTTGITGVTTGTIVTINYNGLTFPNDSYVVLFPNNASTALLSGATMVYATGTTTTFAINTGASALTAATSYSWNYIVVGF